MNLMASSISYPRSVTVTKPCVHNEKRRLSKPAFQGGLTFVLRAEPSDRTPQQRQTNSTKAHTFRFRPLCIRVRQFVDTWALHNTYDPHTIYLMNMKQFVVALSLFPIKVLQARKPCHKESGRSSLASSQGCFKSERRKLVAMAFNPRAMASNTIGWTVEGLVFACVWL